MPETRMVRIALLGEHNPSSETHIATVQAIIDSSSTLGAAIVGEWLSSQSVSEESLSGYDGLWVTPGPPHINLESTLKVIRHARETNIPTFGNCGGFQLLAIEIARTILGLREAQHEEYSPQADTKVVIPLSCSLRGQELSINITDQSLAGRLYRRTRVTERYYCRFGINPEYRSRFFSSPISITGLDDDGEIRAFEISRHPFFLATLYVPQVQSSPGTPHPLVTGFLEACMLRHNKRMVQTALGASTS